MNFGRVVFEMRAERQTNRHTDTLITILCTSTGSEITKSIGCAASLNHLVNCDAIYSRVV